MTPVGGHVYKAPIPRGTEPQFFVPRLEEALKVALLIDGGHLRVRARLAGFNYTPDFIVSVAKACLDPVEELPFRFFYYDCPPFQGTLKAPVSKSKVSIPGSDEWLRDLAARDLFAVRLGVVKFRGWKLVSDAVRREPQDEDYRADFEQKGVDLRMGLDIASLGHDRVVDRVLVITADTDLIPALKFGRKAGLQVVGAELPGVKLTREFLTHLDFHRRVEWPHGLAKAGPRPGRAVMQAARG